MRTESQINSQPPINTHTLKALEWEKITGELAGFSTSETGKIRCLETEIYSNPQTIKSKLKQTTEARYFLDRAVYPPISGINNTYKAVKAAETWQTLNNLELVSIGKNLEIARQAKDFFFKYKEETSLLYEVAERLEENPELEKNIFDTFDEAGNILESASPELKSLSASLKAQTENLKDKLNRFITSQDNATYFQTPVYTMRNERYVVPVKIEHKSHVPGITHDVSSSGATIFVEPKQFVEINNRLKETELAIDAEIKRILSEISRKVKENADNLNLNLDILTEIDFIFAKARYSIFLNATEPEINSEKFLSLKNAKHPILLKVIKKVVPNNVELGKDFQIMLITGPNTGGKTVILKTVGLCILMAKAGLHIPADEANIYPFLKIFADIGDEQSLIQSLSTFSGHIKNIIEILENTDKETLILLDEVGAGTDPMEGTALAEALMGNIQQKGANAMVTTHFSELKALAYTKEGFYNASVEFDTETLSPTFKLIMGLPGKSNAIFIAGNLGLDPVIVAEAKHNYLNKKDPTGEVLEGLQNTQQKLSKDAREIEEKKNIIKELETTYNKELEKLKSEKKKIISVYRKKFDAAYFEAKEEIGHILEESRRTKSEKIAKKSLGKLSEAVSAGKKLDYEEAEKLEPHHDPANWEVLKIGDAVYIKSLGEEGLLTSLPDKNGNVRVEIGILKTKVNKEEIFKSKKDKPEKKEFCPKRCFRLEKRDVSSSLDLRGQTAEDALVKVDYFLDKASLANLTPVCIIHGHGTGKLRKEVRDHLKKSAYAAKFRQGEEGEGGNGVTIVDIV